MFCFSIDKKLIANTCKLLNLYPRLLITTHVCCGHYALKAAEDCLIESLRASSQRGVHTGSHPQDCVFYRAQWCKSLSATHLVFTELSNKDQNVNVN